MAAVDELPAIPTRGGNAPDASTGPDMSGGGMGDLAGLIRDQDRNQQKQDVEEVMQKMRTDVGRTMRQFEAYAGQFPAASKEADMVKKALDSFLRAIVKNAPSSSNQSSPMVPA